MRTDDGFEHVAWADVKKGDTVYIDNYQDGKFPLANPRVSGPYTVIDTETRTLETQWLVKWMGRGEGIKKTFRSCPENLLKA
jgi:hypothetical protein